MNPPLPKRLVALFSEYDSPTSDLRFVTYANGGSALVMAIAIWLAIAGTHIVPETFVWMGALTLFLFALLTVCMVVRYAFWFPAVLVALVYGAIIGAPLWALAYHLHPLARWPGGVVGFLLGFGSVFRTYVKVSAIAQKATMPSEAALLD